MIGPRGRKPLRQPGVPTRIGPHELEKEQRLKSEVLHGPEAERDVLPLLSWGPYASYDPLTKELEPRFVVHIYQLWTPRDEVTFIVERAESLHAKVLAEQETIR